MSVKMRQIVEKEIATSIIEALLKAGYAITIDNGDSEQYKLKGSTNQTNILKHMFLTDEDVLYAVKNGERVGWVRLIYGNDGWDVMSDYTVNLEKLIGEGTSTDKLIEKYAD